MSIYIQKKMQDTIDHIKTLDEWALLETVISHPFYLTDSYYVEVRKAILDRYQEVLKNKPVPVDPDLGFGSIIWRGWP